MFDRKSIMQKNIKGDCQGCDQGKNLIHKTEDTSVLWTNKSGRSLNTHKIVWTRVLQRSPKTRKSTKNWKEPILPKKVVGTD